MNTSLSARTIETGFTSLLPPPRTACERRVEGAGRDAMHHTLALVLAGGRGERLGALTARRAKPAVPIAGTFRIIDFTLSNCLNSGLSQVGVLTQYLSHSLGPHLERWRSMMAGEARLSTLPACSQGGYLGTADAVHQNRDLIRRLAPEQVLVLAADHVYKMDYRAMLAEHRLRRAHVTVGCVDVPLEQASAFGVMQIAHDGRVESFVEKPSVPRAAPGHPEAALASMGIYIFETGFLLDAMRADARRPGSSHDFGKDLIPASVVGGRIHAHRLGDGGSSPGFPYWRDVGTIDAYWRTHMDLVRGEGLDAQDRSWPIRSTLAEACDASRAPCVGGVAAEICIGPGSVIEDSVVFPGARIGAGCLIHKAIIEEGCCIEDGAVIGAATAGARGHYLSPQGVTLVAPPRCAA